MPDIKICMENAYELKKKTVYDFGTFTLLQRFSTF